ncbi:subunit length determinant protein [Larkinella arboricola]|uniref:Subunit length determinant protein n=1 Tax=Larkinella arboricola TaxID=643671 RepID=A0A327WSD8_LARAB|nr:Wzz/FepE/Etk N-terminal domain-containing protein [Larkinella arboricola]RAJ94593.1 subunit length determinant protein [Larkinella arboricola]
MNSYTINQKPRESLNSQENNNIIVFLWVKYFPYWPIFIVLIILAISGVWLYLRFKLPVYESTATLLINDEKKGIEGSKMMESLNPLSSKKIIENEIEVIKSRALIKQVIIDLGLYAPIYKEAIWKDISAYSISPIKIEVRHPDALIEVKKVNFRYNSAEGTVHFNGNNYALDKWITTPWGEFRVTSNNKHNHNGVFYFALINPKRIVNILNKSIDVAAVGKLSSVVNLKIRDEDPKRSEDILNKLIEAYSKAAINDKNLLANNALVFLNERLESVAKDLSSVEEKTERYRARYGAIDISSQGKLLLQNLSINDQKISDTNIKLAVLEQVEQYIISRNIQNSFVPSTIGIDDPVLTELLNKLYNIELQNDKLKLTTGENNPDMVSLSDQIRKLKSNILENVHNQIKRFLCRKLSIV